MIVKGQKWRKGYGVVSTGTGRGKQKSQMVAEAVKVVPALSTAQDLEFCLHFTTVCINQGFKFENTSFVWFVIYWWWRSHEQRWWVAVAGLNERKRRGKREREKEEGSDRREKQNKNTKNKGKLS